MSKMTYAQQKLAEEIRRTRCWGKTVGYYWDYELIDQIVINLPPLAENLYFEPMRFELRCTVQFAEWFDYVQMRYNVQLPSNELGFLVSISHHSLADTKHAGDILRHQMDKLREMMDEEYLHKLLTYERIGEMVQKADQKEDPTKVMHREIKALNRYYTEAKASSGPVSVRAMSSRPI